MSTKRFQTVVVGLDYSPYSEKVLKQAHALAKSYKAKLVAVFATLDPSELLYTTLSSQFESLSLDETKDNFVKHYRLNAKNAQAVVVYGAPEDALITVAKKNKDPLIVVGHRGHSKITQFLLGSTAERLALTSPFALWIHRGNKTITWPKILVPHDLRKISDKALLLANRFQSSLSNIEAYFVFQEPLPLLNYEGWMTEHNKLVQRTQKALLKFKKSHPKVKVKSIKGEPVESIVKHSRKFNLVVMCPHSHRENFHPLGKVTHKVVRSVNVPVLIAK